MREADGGMGAGVWGLYQGVRGMRLTGIFDYVRHGDVAERMDRGWRYAASLDVPHGEYSALMWFCVGECTEDEARHARQIRRTGDAGRYHGSLSESGEEENGCGQLPTEAQARPVR